MAKYQRTVFVILFCPLYLIVAGCGKTTETFPEKAARPITVLTLEKKTPLRSYMVSGAVKSWKTEQIGFEVPGRVEWVLEPGNDIERRVAGADGEWFSEGTPLAKIDPTRYEVALESANARYEVAVLNKDSIEIRLTDAFPAELKSAKADLELAEDEAERIEKLYRQNAASLSEREQVINTVQTRKARIASLEASEKQARADSKAAIAQIKSARQDVLDAERDLENTTLYASYRGQISDVHVVPGSVVTPGSPVLTLQMMDPIKVEIEVSAEKSRELRRRQQLRVSFQLPDGSTKHENAFIYNIDTSANPTSRTFTLTLLLLNDKFLSPIPDGSSEQTIARAADIWPLRVNRIVGAPEDVSIVEENSIFEDDHGHFILQVTNAQFGEAFPDLLRVKRQPVTLQELRIPFLGVWFLQSVKFTNNDEMHDRSLVVGSVKVDDCSVADWQGDTVVLDSGARWVLRPGDLVDVNLSGSSAVDFGYYVPVSAIYEDAGETFLFVVENDTVRKLSIDAVMSQTLSDGSMIEVKSPDINDGTQIAVDGVHFLNDGDRVKRVASYGQTEE